MSSIKDENNFSDLISDIKKLGSKSVDAGWMNDMQNIATAHEFGLQILVTESIRTLFAGAGYPLGPSVKHINILQKAYVRKTGENNSAIERIADLFDEQFWELVNGNRTPEQVLEVVGEFMANEIRKTASRDLQSGNPVVTELNMKAIDPKADIDSFLDALGWEVVNG